MKPWVIAQEIDLDTYAPTMLLYPHTLMFVGDKLAHTWRIRVTSGGVPVDLSRDNVRGYFVNANGQTSIVNGTGTKDGVAEVTLAASCYAVEGKLKGILQASLGGQVVTLGAYYFTVSKSATEVYIDPDDIVPDLTELLDKIAAMEVATAASVEATTDSVAATTAAKTATTNANNATTAAKTATTNANTATTNANNARDAANAAATAADKATTAANTAAGKADTATKNANDATSKANTAATDANAAKKAADTAASSANTAAGAANQAAERISNLSVDVEMLAPGADAYAVVTQTTTAMDIDLFVPKGTISYATFDIDPLTGILWMYTNDGYTGPEFFVNENGELEVMISA